MKGKELCCKVWQGMNCIKWEDKEGIVLYGMAGQWVVLCCIVWYGGCCVVYTSDG